MNLLNHSRLWDFHGIPCIPLPLPWSIRTPFLWTSKKQWTFSGTLSGINFLHFLWVSMDSTDNFCGIHGAIGLHFHGIHSMLSIDVHATMDATEEVEFYRIPRKPWNLIWLRIDINCWENNPRTETILNTIFIINVVTKLLVELKYKTKDNLIPRPWKMMPPDISKISWIFCWQPFCF